VINFINRTITHNRDTAGDFGIRAVIHFPIGFYMGLLDWLNGCVRLFIFYEKNEDLHTQDQAWKDTAGALAGWIVGRLILTAAVIGGLSWLSVTGA